MMIRTFQTHHPKISPSSFVDETAVIIGQCDINDNSSIWPLTVLRGDVQHIIIGEGSNIQDGSIIHCASATLSPPHGHRTSIGRFVTVGHGVMLHACHIEDLCLIGMGSIVMDEAIIEKHVMLGAHALVTPKQHLQSGYLYLGSPAKAVRKLTQEEINHIELSASHYIQLAQAHKDN